MQQQNEHVHTLSIARIVSNCNYFNQHSRTRAKCTQRAWAAIGVVFKDVVVNNAESLSLRAKIIPAVKTGDEKYPSEIESSIQV